jgi:hypothetical protein
MGGGVCSISGRHPTIPATAKAQAPAITGPQRPERNLVKILAHIVINGAQPHASIVN